MGTILIIDDDTELCELLTEYLSTEGFQVEAAHTGDAGLERALCGEIELIILDVMLPVMGGFDVLREIQAKTNLPVIMLTARGDEVDRIVGLEMGADDYLAKPFNPRELLARIKAVLRRGGRRGTVIGPRESAPRMVVADVDMDPATRTVRRDGEVVDLTTVEFNVLAVLLREAGRAVSREELTELGLGRALAPYDRSIDVHVSNIRRKLGRQVRGMDRIKSIRGVGYLYVAPNEGA